MSNKSLALSVLVFALISRGVPAAAAPCTATGFERDGINMTAAFINPPFVTGEIDATGCNIGVYFSDTIDARVENADIHGANYFGIVVNGDPGGSPNVDIVDSRIHDIGETPLNGTQHGVAIYYRNFGVGTPSGRMVGNTLTNYQKGGIVANGTGVRVEVRDNIVTGLGPVNFIAANGIQIGYGASASVMHNTVTGNSYTGTSDVAGGILVVGGPYYGGDYTTNTRIEGNTVANNDIGVYLSNLDEHGGAPDHATNVKAVNNTISSDGLHNNYGGFGYQAGVSDVGNNDKIINNTISGAGYSPAANPSAYTVAVDADPSFTNRPKVHANK